MEFHSVRLWTICVALAILGLAPMNLDYAFPNNAQSAIQKFFQVSIFGNSTSGEINLVWSCFISSFEVGNILASIITPFFAEKLGRPRCLAVGVLVTIVGHALQGVAQLAGAWPLMFVGRFIVSFGTLPFEIVLLIFLSEIAPPVIRGKLGTLGPVGMLVGILLANVFGLPQVLGNDTLWPYGFVICALMGLPAIILALSLKETPVYSMASGMNEKAMNALLFYRGDSDDLKKVQVDAESKKRGMKPGLTAFYHLCKTKQLRKPVIIGAMVVVAYNSSRMFNLYSTAIFHTAGFPNTTATFLSLGLQIASVFCYLVCFLLVDHWGRRPLLLTGLIGGITSWSGLAICQLVITLSSHQTAKYWAGVVFCILTFCAQIFLNTGVRPVFWVLIPEIFPFNFRSVGKSFAIFILGFTGLVFVLLFYLLLGSFPPAAHFFMLIILSVVLAYLWRHLRETKGKAPHEIFPEFLDLPNLDEEKRPLLAEFDKANL